MDNLNEIYDDMKEAAPTAWAEFQKFIDKYKAEAAWPFLFSPENLKFHDLPYDMQVGVILRFIDVVGNKKTLADSREQLERIIRQGFARVDEVLTPDSWKKPLDTFNKSFKANFGTTDTPKRD